MFFLLPSKERNHRTESTKYPRYLAPGDTCFPLSPGPKGDDIVDYKDQMRHILDASGELDDSDKAFISKPAARSYVDKLSKITAGAVNR